jgi:hypothetical protein
MAVVVTAGQRGDSPQFIAVVAKVRVSRAGGGRPQTRPDTVLADKAYTSKAERAQEPPHRLPAVGRLSCVAHCVCPAEEFTRRFALRGQRARWRWVRR